MDALKNNGKVIVAKMVKLFDPGCVQRPLVIPARGVGAVARGVGAVARGVGAVSGRRPAL